MNSKYFSFIKSQFPNLPNEAQNLVSEKLLSPFVVNLDSTLLKQAQHVVHQLFQLRENSTYVDFVSKTGPDVAKFNPGNNSICMSYDFHLDPNGVLKLIEVNTNAAFFLMAYYLYQCKGLSLPIEDFSLEEFHGNCQQECRSSLGPFDSIAIIDDQPTTQRLYFEFLLYKELFHQFGHEVFILDPRELSFSENQLQYNGKKLDFIYNRTTNFYLEQPHLAPINAAYQGHRATLSPNPHEYALLADKQRLIDWSLALMETPSQWKELDSLRPHLLEAVPLTSKNSDLLWNQRKKYFFKPLNSFGSKGTYRGEGISRTYFDQLIDQNTLAQEYCPPPERLFESKETEPTKLKFDLRFYAYRDRVQMAIARLYQGQVTNLRTSLGGFAPITFSSPPGETPT